MAIWQTLRSKLGIDGPRLPPYWVNAVDTSGRDDALRHFAEQHDDEAQAISIEGGLEVELECVALSDGGESVIIRCGDVTVGKLRDDYARQYAPLIARAGGEVGVPGLVYLEDADDAALPQLLIDLPDPEDLT